jgi:hypothetical protein
MATRIISPRTSVGVRDGCGDGGDGGDGAGDVGRPAGPPSPKRLSCGSSIDIRPPGGKLWMLYSLSLLERAGVREHAAKL